MCDDQVCHRMHHCPTRETEEMSLKAIFQKLGGFTIRGRGGGRGGAEFPDGHWEAKFLEGLDS